MGLTSISINSALVIMRRLEKQVSKYLQHAVYHQTKMLD